SSEPPPVDFAQEMAIAVFRGEQPTAGFGLEIQKLEEKGGNLYLYVQEASPAPGSAVLQVLTQPYHIIKLERKDIPVRIVYQAPQE
ncbi:MAG: protease complex subunit PrcB family protein, partial [Candidatus Methylomirabilales bacterium]